MAADNRTATIANNAQVTSDPPINLHKSATNEKYDPTPVRLSLPLGWVSCDVTFDGSVDGGSTFQAVYKEDGTTEVKLIDTAASRTYPLLPVWFAGLTHMKVKTSQQQTGGAKTVVVTLKDF